jgi:hypothetical protein
MESALKGVLKVLKAHDPSHNWEKDPDLKRALAGKLMALADAGVQDPDDGVATRGARTPPKTLVESATG